jgi:hypothetical protein
LCRFEFEQKQREQRKKGKQKKERREGGEKWKGRRTAESQIKIRLSGFWLCGRRRLHLVLVSTSLWLWRFLVIVMVYGLLSEGTFSFINR